MAFSTDPVKYISLIQAIIQKESLEFGFDPKNWRYITTDTPTNFILLPERHPRVYCFGLLSPDVNRAIYTHLNLQHLYTHSVIPKDSGGYLYLIYRPEKEQSWIEINQPQI